MITNYSRVGLRYNNCRSLTNYAFTLNLLDGEGAVANNTIKNLLSKRIVGKVRNDLQTNKRPFTLDYLVERTVGGNIVDKVIDPRVGWVKDKLKCGPIVLSCDLNKHSKEEASFLGGITSTKKYQIAVMSDEDLVTMRQQSNEIRSQYSFEIFSNPRLTREDSQYFFTTALKFLGSVNLSDNCADPALPTVQLRGLRSGSLRPSVLYYPKTPAQFYKCVLLDSFYKQYLKGKSPDKKASREDKVFSVEKPVNFTEVRMAPIDISHHLNVASNKNIVCLSQGPWSRQTRGMLTPQALSALCQSIGVDIPPENVLNLEDVHRTFYLVCTREEDVTVLVDHLSPLVDNISYQLHKNGKRSPKKILKNRKGHRHAEKSVVVSGGLVFEPGMFAQKKPIRSGNVMGAMFCPMPKAKTGRLVKFWAGNTKTAAELSPTDESWLADQ